MNEPINKTELESQIQKTNIVTRGQEARNG